MRSSKPPAPAKTRVTLYKKDDCCLCEDALRELRSLQQTYPFDLELVDIQTDPSLFEKFKSDIPVVAINGRIRLKHKILPKLMVHYLEGVSRRS